MFLCASSTSGTIGMMRSIALCVCCCLFYIALGADQPPKLSQGKQSQAHNAKVVPLNEQKTVLLDRDAGKLILETEVVLRAGLLEMLVCLKQTKEHESILSFDGKASTVHAGLLALELEPGKPVKFLPEFEPPSGPVIDIHLMWQDEQKKWHRVKAQEWVRGVTRKYFIATLKDLPKGLEIPDSSELRYDPKHDELLWFGLMSEKQRDELLGMSENKDFQTAVRELYKSAQLRPMKADWVFAGSGVHTDEKTGESYYLAESGDLICVANFSSATLDVREQSSASNEGGLSFEAWEERIPSIGTKVRVELVPRKAKIAETKTNTSP